MHVFSPERANALIPVLTPLVEQLWEKRRELAIRLLESDPALRAARSVPVRLAARGLARPGSRRALNCDGAVSAIN